MGTVSITKAKAKLAELLASDKPVTVTRRGKPLGVIAGHLDETGYLLSTPANAKRLRAAVAEVNRSIERRRNRKR